MSTDVENNPNTAATSGGGNAADVATVTPEKPADPDHGPTGCYLVYEPSSGGRLMLYYSQGPVPSNAVGFWCPGPGKKIQPFKFRQAAGRVELIKGIAGGDANRRKYFSGWCQFLKLAVAMKGTVIQFTAQQGVPVDVYGYQKDKNHPEFIDTQSGMVDVSTFDAVAVMPKHHEFLKGVKTIALQNFLEMGNIAGCSTTMN